MCLLIIFFYFSGIWIKSWSKVKQGSKEKIIILKIFRELILSLVDDLEPLTSIICKLVDEH